MRNAEQEHHSLHAQIDTVDTMDTILNKKLKKKTLSTSIQWLHTWGAGVKAK